MLPNPWLILGVVLAWVASLGVVGVWQNKAGHTAEKVITQAKENAQLVAANKEIERLRKVEQVGAAQIITIGDDHAQHVAALKAQQARDLANARSGALKLRIPNACSPAIGAGQVPASTPSGNGAAGTELPAEITGRLFDLANDADRNTLQLTACQQVVRSYLKTQESP